MKYQSIINRSHKIIEDACDKKEVTELNLVINSLSAYPLGAIRNDYIERLFKNKNLDEWLNRRVKQELALGPIHLDSEEKKAEAWAYRFGYFERRLVKREPNRKYLNYIFLLGNWLTSEPDLPRTYVQSLLRICLRLYRTRPLPVRKEVLRLMGKILRNPPRELSPRLHNLMHEKLIKSLQDSSWEIRIFAAAGLLHTDNKLVNDFLAETLLEKLPQLREEVAFELFELMRNIQSPGITAILLRLYSQYVTAGISIDKDSNPDYPISNICIWICEALAYHGSDLPFEPMVSYLCVPQVTEFEKARLTDAILKIKNKVSFNQIQSLASHKEPWGRSLAAILIGERRKAAEIPLLALLLNDSYLITRENAIKAANKVKFHGSKTMLGQIKGGRINYFLDRKETNPLLKRELMQSNLIGLNNEELAHQTKQAVKENNVHMMFAISDYLARYPLQEQLDSFSHLLKAKDQYFAKKFTFVYLKNRKSPSPFVLLQMLRHEDFEIRIHTAVFIVHFFKVQNLPTTSKISKQ